VQLERLLREAADHADGTRLPRLGAEVSGVRGARLPPSHRSRAELRVPFSRSRGCHGWHRGSGCSASDHWHPLAV